MPTFPYVPFTYVGTANEVTTTRLNASELGIRDAHFQPAVRVFHNAAQSLTTGVATALAFNSERFDQAGNAADTMHDTVTNNSRLTCRYAGVYLIFGTVEFNTSATGTRVVDIVLNGTTSIARELENASATGGTNMTISTPYALAVNDFVTLVCIQNSGGALNVNSTANISPEFAMVRVG